jgi:hypothetical protein
LGIYIFGGCVEEGAENRVLLGRLSDLDEDKRRRHRGITIRLFGGGSPPASLTWIWLMQSACFYIHKELVLVTKRGYIKIKK